MQTSVAPRSQASRARRAISPAATRYGRPRRLLRERALGERAEAAAEVADVRVVDVAVDDVGHGVAVDLAPRSASAARRQRRSPAPRASNSASRSPRRASRRLGQRRATEASIGQSDTPRRSSRSTSGGGRRRRRRRHRRAARPPSRRSRARPSASDRRSTAARTAGVEPPASLLQRNSGTSRAAAQALAARPRSRARAARSRGHGASGFTWSSVTGDTPPQSLMPASSSRGKSAVRQIRRRLDVPSGPEHDARAAAIVHSSSSSDGLRRGRPSSCPASRGSSGR